MITVMWNNEKFILIYSSELGNRSASLSKHDLYGEILGMIYSEMGYQGAIDHCTKNLRDIMIIETQD